MKYVQLEGNGRNSGRRKVGSYLLGAGACVAAAVVVGPTGAALANSHKANASKALPTVNLAYVAPVSDLELPLIAEDEGFFKKYGVNVTVSLLPQTEAIPAIVSGQIQMAAFQGPGPEVQLANGTPLKWLMQWENHSDSALIARNGVTSLAQLSGKTIGITTAGTSSQILAQMALSKVGVTANLQPLGSVSAMAAAFQAGSISATIVSPPQDLALVKSVPGAKLLLNYDTQFAWPGGGLAALSSWTSKNSATTVKVLEGMTAALNYMRVHPAGAEKIIATADDETLAEATAGFKATISLVDQLKTLAPNATAEKDVLSEIKGPYPGAAKLTPSSVSTPSYITQAEKKVKFKVG
jgi:NitT/TauT family transport system substrate-binding protein